MKNYKQTAADVLRLVGGDKNVSHLEHCSTRLRFTLADPAKADAAALKKTPGVMGVIASGPGIASMAMYIDPANSMNFVWACVGFAISVAASFILTLILYKDEDDTDAPSAEAAPDSSAKPASCTIASPLEGKAVPLTSVKDEVFSQKILGDGIAVVPSKGELYAPADGTIESVFESKHAISMVTSTGAELLMHIGMDTVKLEGKGFAPAVKNGDKVQKGQLLMKFDIAAIQAAGFDTTTPIVVTNGDTFTVTPAADGAVKPGATLMKLEAVQ